MPPRLLRFLRGRVSLGPRLPRASGLCGLRERSESWMPGWQISGSAPRARRDGRTSARAQVEGRPGVVPGPPCMLAPERVRTADRRVAMPASGRAPAASPGRGGAVADACAGDPPGPPRRSARGVPDRGDRHPSDRRGRGAVAAMAAGINYNNVWAAQGIPIDVIAVRPARPGRAPTNHVGGLRRLRHRLRGRRGRDPTSGSATR